MKTLIVSDAHENIPTLERILTIAPAHDEVVFLGDWFDSWTHDSATSWRTIETLKRLTKNPHYTFLWGNHDLPYAFPHLRQLRCSGNQRETFEQVARESWPDLFGRFKPYEWRHDWLLSHAGFTELTLNQNLSDQPYTQDSIPDPLLLQVGWLRGGGHAVGGPTWLDWNDEFTPIPDVNQIVGHTEGKAPRERTVLHEIGCSWNLCLDTGLKHFALLDDDSRVSVYAVTDVTAPIFVIEPAR